MAKTRLTLSLPFNVILSHLFSIHSNQNESKSAKFSLMTFFRCWLKLHPVSDFVRHPSFCYVDVIDLIYDLPTMTILFSVSINVNLFFLNTIRYVSYFSGYDIVINIYSFMQSSSGNYSWKMGPLPEEHRNQEVRVQHSKQMWLKKKYELDVSRSLKIRLEKENTRVSF